MLRRDRDFFCIADNLLAAFDEERADALLHDSVLTTLLVAAGCASTSKVMLGRARAPIDPALVQIYSTPPAGSQEIAQLESSSAVGFGTQVPRLPDAAAEAGSLPARRVDIILFTPQT